MIQRSKTQNPRHRAAGFSLRDFAIAVIHSRALILALLLMLPVSSAIARDEQPDAMVDPLAAKQRMILDRLNRLEDRMFRLREKLSETEPENATKLALAIERAGEVNAADRMAELIKLLEASNDLNEASDEQTDLVNDLELILAALMDRPDIDTGREEEIQRLEEYKEKLDELLNQQRELRTQSADAIKARIQAKQLQQAIEQLDKLIEGQQSLNQSAQQAQSKSNPKQSQQQGELAEKTEQLSENVERATDEDSPKEASDAVEALKDASSSMKKSDESAKEGKSSEAERQGEDALEELKRAKHKLEEAKEKLEQKAEAAGLSKEQGKTADQAGDLSKEMKGGQQQNGQQSDQQQGGQKQDGGQQGKKGQQQQGQQNQGQQGQQGQQQGGQQGGQQQQSEPQPDTPGQRKVEEAEKQMREAEKNLEDEELEDATKDQDEAIDALQRARQELEEVLKQLRQEEQEEVLRGLEERFREMLANQEPINQKTADLDRAKRMTESGEPGARFGRAEELSLSELATKQRDLATMAGQCLHILEEDGTTVVFPAVIEQLSQDMEHVSDRMAALRLGALTLGMQDDILTTLREMLQAVEEMQEKLKQQQGEGGGGGGGGEEALLPGSAELKMLKASQVRVHRRTKLLDDARQAGEESTDSAGLTAENLAERQKEVADIAKEMRDRLDQP